MSATRSAAVVIIGMTALASPAIANQCQNISASASNWTSLADSLETVTNTGTPTQDQAAWFDAEINKNIPYTQSLVSTLSRAGSVRGKKLSRLLQRSLESLEQADSFDQIIDAMDSITDSMGRILPDCESLGASEPTIRSETSEPSSPPAPSPASQPSSEEPAVLVSFEPAPPELQNLATALHDSGVFQQWATYITAAYRLPRHLPISFRACGEANAFYSTDGQVSVCYELLAMASNLFLNLGYEDDETYRAVLGAGTFFLLHELGHAFVDQMQLPITGREEDAVDGLATLILLNSGNHDAVLSTVDYWDSLASLQAEAGGELVFWDEHSLDEQRVYDLACMVYGSDPQTYAALASDDYIPHQRAVQCPAEFERKSRAWNQLLAPHTRTH